MKDYTEAKLYTCKGVLTGTWYAYFFVNCADEDGQIKSKMFIRKQGINRLKGKREKTTYGNELVRQINNLLSEGWRPRGAAKIEKPVDLIAKLYELLELKKGLRTRTWQSYQYSIDVLVKWLKKNHYDYFMPSDFTVTVCHNFFDSLQKQKLAGKTLNGHKGQLSIFFNMLVDRDIITKNPFSKIKPYPENTGRNIAYSDEQKEDLIKHMKANNYRLYIFTQWIYFTCIRPIELLRLRVGNVDLKNKNIVIYSDQSKNKKMESVVIPDAFMPIIKEMKLQDHPKSDYIFGLCLETTDLPYNRNSVSLAFGKVLKALKYGSDYTLYSWKHTSVVNAFNAGINPYAIQRQLRHHSLDETMRYLKSLGLLRNDEFGSKMK